MEPAQSIIAKFGGEEKVAEITGTSYTAPYRWQHAREKGGTGGLIPQKQAIKLLEYAREHAIDVRADSFLPTPIDPAPSPAGPEEAAAS